MPTLSRRHYLFLLLLILIFAAVTRFYRLAEPKEYIFDEVYHAVTSKLIRRNDPRAYEWWNPPVEPNTAVDWLHPPLAKYTQALGMEIFGENSFGWRISSAIFGVLVIAATAQLADQLFQSKKVALFAAALASLDGLLLVQSRIAMNDIHVTFFILLTLICYLRYRRQPPRKSGQPRWSWLFLTGLSAGLAMGSKWSGIFALVVVCLSELCCFLYDWRTTKKQNRKLSFLVTHLTAYIVLLCVLPGLIYILAYTHMFLQGKTLICQGNHAEQGKCYCSQNSSWWVDVLEKYGPSNQWMWQTTAGIPLIWQNLPNHPSLVSPLSYMPNFWENLEARGGCKRLVSHFSELQYQIWYYQTHLDATHPYQSRPLQWFFDLRPVWYYTKNTTDTAINIYTFGNPLLFWFGDVAIFLTIDYLIARVVFAILSHDRQTKLSATLAKHNFYQLLFVLVAYGMVWLPWQFSPRIMFFYHYTPAVPLLCIILAYWLVKLGNTKVLIDGKKTKLEFISYLVLTLVFACFVVWYPDWIALPVPMEFANHVYFLLNSWR